jgi:hypothetical protein
MTRGAAMKLAVITWSTLLEASEKKKVLLSIDTSKLQKNLEKE